jgi:hypothetical protein
MCVKKNAALFPLLLLAMNLPAIGAKKLHKAAEATGPAILWRNPTDLPSRDLFYGPGGKRDEPSGTFTFVKEDLNGTNPKFVVRDQQGIRWIVKLGIEARPETVATRLAWAVGYYANEDYFVRELKVRDMPARLHRGQNLVAADGTVHDVRLKREDRHAERKIGSWQWRHNAFTNTRELNGLRVLMAVINSWDLKDENTAIYQDGGERVYMVSDLGASFGAYSRSRFLRRVTAHAVDFEVPARPNFRYAVNPKEYLRRVRLEWIGRNVPRSDARWMGQLLARLSPRQIREAFRAAGYSPQETEEFAKVVQNRIAALTDL